MKKIILSVLTATTVLFGLSNNAFAFFDPANSPKCPTGLAYYNFDGYINEKGEHIDHYTGCGVGKPFTCADGTVVTAPNFYYPLNEYLFYQLCPTPVAKTSAIMISVTEGEYLNSQTEGTANITIPDSAEGKIVIFSSKSEINWVISNPNKVAVSKIIVIAARNVRPDGNVDIFHHQRLSGDVPNVLIEKPYVVYAGKDRDAYFLKRGITISSEDTYSAGRAGDLPKSISPNGTPFGDKVKESSKITLTATPSNPVVGDKVTISWNNAQSEYDLCQLEIASIGNFIFKTPEKLGYDKAVIVTMPSNPGPLAEVPTEVKAKLNTSSAHAYFYNYKSGSKEAMYDVTLNQKGVYELPVIKKAGELTARITCQSRQMVFGSLMGMPSNDSDTLTIKIGDGVVRAKYDEYYTVPTDPSLLFGSKPTTPYVHVTGDASRSGYDQLNTYGGLFTKEQALDWCKRPRGAYGKNLMCFWNNQFLYGVSDGDGVITDITNPTQARILSKMPGLVYNGVHYGLASTSGVTSSSAVTTPTLPSGCTSSTAYSRTTGVRCVNSSNGTGSSSNRTPDGSSSLGSQTDSSAGTTSNPPSTTKAIYRQYYGTALKQYRSRVTRAQAVTLCNTRVAYVEGRAASGKTTESDISKVKCMWGEEKIYPVDDTTSSLVLKISSISRSSGAIGAQVTIYGNGFLQNSKVSFIKNINTTTYQSETFVPDTVTVGADGKSLTFVVPSQVITDACRLASSATGYSACDELAFPVVSGPYSVRVKNENVTSNAVSFNVLNASTDCSAPGAMLTDACANQSNAGQGGSGSVLGVSTSALCADLPRNLHRGTESPSVSLLQSFLLEKGFMEGEVTGFYGDKTVEAVKDYQASVGLPTTGMVYDFTRDAMRAESCR